MRCFLRGMPVAPSNHDSTCVLLLGLISGIKPWDVFRNAGSVLKSSMVIFLRENFSFRRVTGCGEFF